MGHRDPDHGDRRALDRVAAGVAVSADRSAFDHGERRLSGRLGGDGRDDGDAGSRTADDGSGRVALHRVVLDGVGVGVDHADVRDRHGRGHRPGPGAEQAGAGDVASARDGPAAGNHRGQGVLGLPDGDRADFRGRVARTGGSGGLSRLEPRRRDQPDRGRGRRAGVRRALRDADLARSGAAGGL